MSDEIMVSILCIAYNHEKYIRQCLDSLLMQKTKFKYEIIVHDDASTDNTANIIREYENKYPEIIKPIYQSENQYSKGIKIATFTTPMVKGKYVAHCEGDDFWTDPYKLQKQFDIMEKNPDCSICVHRVSDVLENGEYTGKYHPNFDLEECKMNLEQYFHLKKQYPFQTTSYFLLTDVKKEYTLDPPSFVSEFEVGDEPTILFALTRGSMYYLEETMSSYRLMSNGSWTSRTINDLNYIVKHGNKIINAYKMFNEYTCFKYDVYIKEICRKNSFWLSLRTKDYKTCLKKSNWKYFNKLTPKEKIAVIIYAIFPFLIK